MKWKPKKLRGVHGFVWVCRRLPRRYGKHLFCAVVHRTRATCLKHCAKLNGGSNR